MSIGKLVKKMHVHRQSRITRARQCCDIVRSVISTLVETAPGEARSNAFSHAAAWEKIYRSRVEFIAELEREAPTPIQWKGGKFADRRASQVFEALNTVYTRYFPEMSVMQFYAVVQAFIEIPRPTSQSIAGGLYPRA